MSKPEETFSIHEVFARCSGDSKKIWGDCPKDGSHSQKEILVTFPDPDKRYVLLLGERRIPLRKIHFKILVWIEVLTPSAPPSAASTYSEQEQCLVKSAHMKYIETEQERQLTVHLTKDGNLLCQDAMMDKTVDIGLSDVKTGQSQKTWAKLDRIEIIKKSPGLPPNSYKAPQCPYEKPLLKAFLLCRDLEDGKPSLNLHRVIDEIRATSFPAKHNFKIFFCWAGLAKPAYHMSIIVYTPGLDVPTKIECPIKTGNNPRFDYIDAPTAELILFCSGIMRLEVFLDNIPIGSFAYPVLEQEGTLLNIQSPSDGPVLQAFLICDGIEEKDDGSFDIIGITNAIEAPQFPFTFPASFFYVWNNLSEAAHQFDIRLPDNSGWGTEIKRSSNAGFAHYGIAKNTAINVRYTGDIELGLSLDGASHALIRYPVFATGTKFNAYGPSET